MKTRGKSSAFSDKPFEPGTSVLCMVYQDAEGGLARADILPEERQAFAVPGRLLAWWLQTVEEDAAKEAAEERRRRTMTVEGLFFSLYGLTLERDPESGAFEVGEEDAEEPPGDVDQPDEGERDILRYLLAVMLERRRKLKPLTPPVFGREQEYLHTRTKRKFTVPPIAAEPERLQKVLGELEGIVG